MAAVPVRMHGREWRLVCARTMAGRGVSEAKCVYVKSRGRCCWPVPASMPAALRLRVPTCVKRKGRKRLNVKMCSD